MKKISVLLLLVILTLPLSGCFKSKLSVAEVESKIKVASLKLKDSKSGIVDLKLNGTGKAVGATATDKPQDVVFNLDFLIKANEVDKVAKKDEVYMNLTGSIKIDKEQSGEIGAEVTFKNDTLYFKLNNFPTLPANGAFVSSIVAAVKGKWWMLPVPPSALPAGVGGEKQLSPQDQKMKDLFEKTHFIKSAQSNGSKTLDSGVKVEEYELILDSLAVQNFIAQVAELTGKPISEADRTNMKSFFDTTVLKVNVDIAEDGDYLAGISGKLDLTGEQLKAPGSSVSMNFAMNIKDLNKPVEILVPAGAVLFDLSKIFSVAPPVTP